MIRLYFTSCYNNINFLNKPLLVDPNSTNFTNFTNSTNSTESTNSTNFTNFTNLLIFLDVEKEKLQILNSGKEKSGIYMWTNKLNGKRYIGSSVLKFSLQPKFAYFSTWSNINSDISFTLALITPVVINFDTFLEKLKIIKDNKNKAGIYRWVNKVNGKTYVGSCVNLGRRIKDYCDISLITYRVKKEIVLFILLF